MDQLVCGPSCKRFHQQAHCDSVPAFAFYKMCSTARWHLYRHFCHTRRIISNQHQLINSHARPFSTSTPKIVALLCLLSCFYFVFFCLFMYICTSCIFLWAPCLWPRSLLRLPPYEQDRFKYDIVWGNNVPFNLSGYCCFEYRDSLKVTL